MGRAESEDEGLIGKTVAAKYRIDRLIGRGGMGAVYQATNTGIGKRVALKFLERDAAGDSDAVVRFQREAEAASAVESAHIVQIFDSGSSEDGRPFLVMELLSGEDLRARLRREGRLPLAEAVHVGGQVLRALGRAHEAGIVHRDLKPDNLFLCERDDDPMFLKIVDFGISKVARKSAPADVLTRRGVVLGTAFYMSPEQAQALADIDGRSDLFSLGAILYEALSGRPPHVGSAYEAVLIAICTKDAEDVRVHAPDVPEQIARVIARALARDRSERFQSAAEFYEALALAAPGLLRTSGPISYDAPERTTERIGGARQAAEPPALRAPATGEGTAVRPNALDSRTQRRRTLIAAAVAGLGGFAVTVIIAAEFRKPRVVEPAPAPAPVAAASAIATSEPLPEPEVVPAASASAEPEPSAKKPPPPIRPLRPPPSAPEPAGSVKKPGVASGLELDTRPP
jgi:eukaryotic-like serine/threonine-protein kinase